MKRLVRGFRDIFPPESDAFARLESVARRVFALYGAKEIRIPTLELKELFVKSTGDTTDIVQKEMYAFEDAGGRMLALRPEGTPGVARAYIENNYAQTSPVQKFFYIGSMFRAERPQAGRYREFEQIGLECMGSSSAYTDAELILMLADIVREFGVKNYSVKINSLGCGKCRPAYREALIKFLSACKNDMCEKCNERLERNPLRVLDCKIDGAKFRETAPKMQLCAECERDFDIVKTTLDGRIEYTVDGNLVRGLDYYNKTVFEFQAGDSAQNAIAGGGRYDGLIKQMGGQDIPAVGFAMGVDRTIAALAAAETAVEKDENGFFVISLSPECDGKAFDLMQAIRAEGRKESGAVKVYGGLFDKNLKTQMKEADRSGARLAFLLGPDEIAGDYVTQKDMKTGEQIKLPSKKLWEKLKNEKN